MSSHSCSAATASMLHLLLQLKASCKLPAGMLLWLLIYLDARTEPQVALCLLPLSNAARESPSTP